MSKTEKSLNNTFEKLVESKQYSTTVNDCQQFQLDRDRERDNDRESDKDNDGDREGERTLCSNSSRRRSADEADEHTLVFYGTNQRPTNSVELRHSEALTDELYSTYMHNKPTRYNYECIFMCA
ncbi:MAG: hypothetical protein E7195_00690 [Peptococcaceae bacterium]|nr:hypothetical protein [Peptococcaceae bacterium]